MFPYNLVIAILCSGIFTLACLYVYELRHPKIVEIEPVDRETILDTFDNAYLSGYQDCKAGLPMHPEIVKRSGLADVSKVNAYVETGQLE